jgi:hypothetical protein
LLALSTEVVAPIVSILLSVMCRRARVSAPQD